MCRLRPTFGPVSEMLTPMTDDFARRRTARERIEARYRTRQEHDDITATGYAPPMPVYEALLRVMATAENPAAESRSYGPADPDGEDLLAALALVAEARDELEDFELRLIRRARISEITWTDIAVPLGLRTRQSAESRAMRLERAAGTGHSSRDVARMRAKRAAERDLAQWATAAEERLRTVAGALVDSSEAWADADIQDRPVLASRIQLLAAQLVADAGGPGLWLSIERVGRDLLPCGHTAPKPAGDKAAAATAAVRELEQLQLLASRTRGNRW
jgi:hypothetical protein